MVNKEEGTALLLTQDEVSEGDHPKVKNAKKNSFIAATFAVSCLCGAGIFISTNSVWCYESGVSYREKELLRFYVLIGGILSALFSGRAIDFFGRRSSVIFAAVCWSLSAVFLSYFAILQWDSRGEVSTQPLISHKPEIAVINSSEKFNHVSQSLLFTINPPPTNPPAVYSLSSKHIGSLNASGISYHNVWYFTSYPFGHSATNSIGSLHENKQTLPLLPRVIASLLVGAASAASIVSASVYVFEISRAGVRARYVAFSDFLSIVFGIFSPLINLNILFLTIVSCAPVITLTLLLLLPLKVPSYLSLPSSPYHLLLKSIIQKRKSHYNTENAGKSSSKNRIFNLLNYFSYSTEKTPFSFTHVIKPTFYFSKNKIYDSDSRKNSASDNDDASFCMNDVMKSSEMDFDKSQMTSAEFPSNFPRVCFEDDAAPQLNANVKSVSEADGLSMAGCCGSDYDEGALAFGMTKIDHEARNTLSYLYGTIEGEEEAEAIHKQYLADMDAACHCRRESFFNMEMKSFRSVTHSLLKLGLPLLIMYMCASDYNDVTTLARDALSKLSICGSTAEAGVSVLKVVCAALSILLLDKIGHKRALMSAVAVLGTSSLLLAFLQPHLLNVQDHPNTAVVTTLPSRPTMYPLLPTPLPQLLLREDSKLVDNVLEKFPYFGDRTLHSHSTSESPVIWLTLVSVICVIGSGTMVVAPLTRVFILSAFPTHNRGSGFAFTFALQYVIHLILFFLPCAFFSSGFSLMFRSGACFAAIILLLCFLKTKNHGQRYNLQRYGFNKNFNPLFSGKICSMSEVNGTAV